MQMSIAIFGEVLLDEFPDGVVIGGAPYNVARSLACFGTDPLMISRTGQDAYAERIQQDMRKAGMRDSGIQTDALHPTGRVVVTLNADQPHSHTFHIVRDQAYDYIDGNQARLHLVQYLEERRCVPEKTIFYFGTLAQRQTTSRAALRTLLTETKANCYLDLNLRQQEVGEDIIREAIAAADILKINDDELRVILAMYPALETFAETSSTVFPSDSLLKAIRIQLGLQALIVTLGAEGYAYTDQQDTVLRGKPQRAITVADTVGAGDAFSAVFLLGLLNQWPVAVTLNRAQAFAGAICEVRGAAGPHTLYQEWQQAWQ